MPSALSPPIPPPSRELSGRLALEEEEKCTVDRRANLTYAEFIHQYVEEGGNAGALSVVIVGGLKFKTSVKVSGPLSTNPTQLVTPGAEDTTLPPGYTWQEGRINASRIACALYPCFLDTPSLNLSFYKDSPITR